MNVFVPDTVKYEKDATILYITIFLLHIYLNAEGCSRKGYNWF